MMNMELFKVKYGSHMDFFPYNDLCHDNIKIKNLIIKCAIEYINLSIILNVMR